MKGMPLITDDGLEIPPKRYFTIGEVAELCGLKTHVLRYWETEFTQLNPVKRRGNRRYYQRDDVLMVRTIQHLLHEEGFTIAGARQKLNQVSGGGNKRAGGEGLAETASGPTHDSFSDALALASGPGGRVREARSSQHTVQDTGAPYNPPSMRQMKEWRESLEAVRDLLSTRGMS